jgi:hypothetical protein
MADPGSGQETFKNKLVIAMRDSEPTSYHWPEMRQHQIQ